MRSTDKLEDFLAKELEYPKHNTQNIEPISKIVQSNELYNNTHMFNENTALV